MYPLDCQGDKIVCKIQDMMCEENQGKYGL